MGKPTGFLEYERENSPAVEPLERIKNFNEFHELMPDEKRRVQGARCMDCGVPFCQSGMILNGALIFLYFFKKSLVQDFLEEKDL